MAMEYELKYAATEAVLEQINSAMSAPAEVYKMQTTYYDTPSRNLGKRHITLRRRLENEKSVCTLKAPAKLGRAEFELECEDIESAIPELCKLSGVDPALLSQGVAPVCGARFIRRARTITLPNATVELALDQGVLLGGHKELPLYEVEVELKDGEPAAAAAYAVELALTYGLQPEPKSKFKRAYDLTKE